MTQKKEFAIKLIEFYKSTITSSIQSIKILAEIQRNFPKEYEIMEELKDDPSIVDQLADVLPQEEKDTMILIFIKASAIGRRMNKLFDLTVEEKEKLIKDLEDFAEFAEKRMKESLERKEEQGGK
jgi:hypothetical protein